MSSLNKVILIGRVGKDPELRYTADGKPVASFSLATSEKRKDNEEKTEWHNIIAWARLAEIVGEYVKKGSLLYCEGRIESHEYTGKDGNKKKQYNIIINAMQMLGSKGGAQQTKETDDDDFMNEEDI
jgi:single-strand DNA-binding protein